MNRVFLSGHLTRAPELKLTPDGTAKVCTFGLAVNERWSDRETGEMRETVCFVEVNAWNRQAELVFEYFKKGSPILIEGSLRFDAWQADDGTNRSRLTVRLNRFEFMAQRTNTAGNAPVQSPPTQDTQPEGNTSQSSDEQPPF